MAQGRTVTRSANGGGEALIGRAARVRGRISGDGDLTIEGHVEGDVSLRGDFTIAAGGGATSNVEAQAVTIAGTLEGDVHAKGAVRLVSGARVRGNLTGESVAIEEGAQFAGRLDCEFELPPELEGATPRRR